MSWGAPLCTAIGRAMRGNGLREPSLYSTRVEGSAPVHWYLVSDRIDDGSMMDAAHQSVVRGREQGEHTLRHRDRNSSIRK